MPQYIKLSSSPPNESFQAPSHEQMKARAKNKTTSTLKEAIQWYQDLYNALEGNELDQDTKKVLFKYGYIPTINRLNKNLINQLKHKMTLQQAPFKRLLALTESDDLDKLYLGIVLEQYCAKQSYEYAKQQSKSKKLVEPSVTKLVETQLKNRHKRISDILFKLKKQMRMSRSTELIELEITSLDSSKTLENNCDTVVKTSRNALSRETTRLINTLKVLAPEKRIDTLLEFLDLVKQFLKLPIPTGKNLVGVTSIDEITRILERSNREFSAVEEMQSHLFLAFELAADCWQLSKIVHAIDTNCNALNKAPAQTTQSYHNVIDGLMTNAKSICLQRLGSKDLHTDPQHFIVQGSQKAVLTAKQNQAALVETLETEPAELIQALHNPHIKARA